MEESKKRHTAWCFTIDESAFSSGEQFNELVGKKHIIETAKNKLQLILGSPESKDGDDWEEPERHVHGVFSTRSLRGSGHAMAKQNAFNCFRHALEQLDPGHDMKEHVYFQPAKDSTGKSYELYANKNSAEAKAKTGSKKTAIYEEVLEGLKLSSKSLTWDNVVEWCKENDSIHYLDMLRSTWKDLQPHLEQVDWQCKPVLDVSAKRGARLAQTFVQGMLTRLGDARIQTPDIIVPRDQEDAQWLVMTYLALATWCKRQADDGMLGLMLNGQAGVGKSSMLATIPYQKRVAADAGGVGRFYIGANQTTLVFNDWTWAQLLQTENSIHIRNVALGELASVKVHSTTKDVHASWLIVTSNDYLHQLDERLTTGEMRQEHVNAQKRRFVFAEWTDVEDDKYERISMAQMNKDYARAYLLEQVFRYMRRYQEEGDSCLWEYGPLRAYLKNVYRDCYQTAFDTLKAFTSELKAVELDFDKETGSDCEELVVNDLVVCEEPKAKVPRMIITLGGVPFVKQTKDTVKESFLDRLNRNASVL